MELETSNFLPLQIATKYYTEWDCETEISTSSQLYYKTLHGNATIKLTNGNRYQGMVHNGLFHGKGKYSWNNGLVYEGNFFNNSITGDGVFKWPNGSVYEGQVWNGYRHGNGKFNSTIDKAEYVGDWVMGKYEGKGTIYFDNGGYYQGQFQKNKKHGKGKMVYPSKNEYEGEWINDKKQGKGIMNWWKQNEKYEGNWQDNLPHSYGEYYWFENKTQYKILKTIYKGNWVKGKRQGFGVFYYSNGCRFQGYFKQNLKDGYGISVDSYGKEKIDAYKNDRLISLAKRELNTDLLLKKKNRSQKQKNQTDKLPKIKKIKLTQPQVPSEKQIVINHLQNPIENQYKNYLDFEHPQINDNFFNFLLRENSVLRIIYKQLCGLSSQLKDCYTGLVLQNYWKVIKELKVLNQCNSLCTLNRQFSQGYKNEFQLIMPEETVIKTLEKDPQMLLSYHYKEIQWQSYFQQLNSAQFDWEQWKFDFNQQLYIQKKLNDIHNPQKIILYRHFICLLIRTACICGELGHNLRKKTQNLIHQLHLSLDGNLKTEKSAINIDYLTQNTKAIFVPDWAKPLTQRLINRLNKNKVQLQGKIDGSITVRTLYVVLQANNILKENMEKMGFLQKIERYMNLKVSLFKRQMKQYFTTFENFVKTNPYFNHVMNYEMVQKQVSEIVYQAIIRKVNCSSQEELIFKYEETIKKLIVFIEQEEDKDENKKLKRKNTESKKDKEKRELIRRTEQEKIKMEEEKRKKEEEEREQKERFKMSLEDKDVQDYFDESDSSDECLF